MIAGTGIDIVEIDRIQRAARNRRFIERVFTKKEILYCEGRGAQAAASFAARFAGKEAVLKAFGTGLIGGELTDIEILPDERGGPKVFLHRYFLQEAENKRIDEIHISLSHAKRYATAQVIFWRERE